MCTHIFTKHTPFLRRNTVPRLYLHVTISSCHIMMPHQSWVYLLCWLPRPNFFAVCWSYRRYVLSEVDLNSLEIGSWKCIQYSILYVYYMCECVSVCLYYSIILGRIAVKRLCWCACVVLTLIWCIKVDCSTWRWLVLMFAVAVKDHWNAECDRHWGSFTSLRTSVPVQTGVSSNFFPLICGHLAAFAVLWQLHMLHLHTS